MDSEKLFAAWVAILHSDRPALPIGWRSQMGFTFLVMIKPRHFKTKDRDDRVFVLALGSAHDV